MGNCAKFNGVQKSIKRTQLTVASSSEHTHTHRYTRLALLSFSISASASGSCSLCFFVVSIIVCCYLGMMTVETFYRLLSIFSLY